jgi:hypothetical protein
MGYTCSPGCCFVIQLGISDPLPIKKEKTMLPSETEQQMKLQRITALGRSPVGPFLWEVFSPHRLVRGKD